MPPDRHQLLHARRALDLTLAEVAGAVGIARSSISLIENGTNSSPSPAMIDKLAEFYRSKGIEFGDEGQVRIPARLREVAGRKVN